MIWITSDLHFCHDRDFIYTPRGFNNVREMNIVILHNLIHNVQWDDDIYILGDIMLNNDEGGLALLKSIPGRIHIILGNHDSNSRRELYENCYNVVEVVDALKLNYKGYHFFLCHYPTLCGNYDAGKPLNHCLINLCGHTHTKDPFVDWDKGLIYHCEIDAHGCAPVSLDSIIEDCIKHR